MSARDKRLKPSERADRGMCPCSHCGINACPLAIMVINNRKILMALSGVEEPEDNDEGQEEL